jgi:recombinational DNA repair protein (RecF pathway)
MAKQAGTIKIQGTIGDICFYRLHEEHYARTKSSLSAKIVKHDPAFDATMKYAALLACASKIASVMYRQLPKEQKSRKRYQAMTGQAMRLLKEKMNIEAIIQVLGLNKV